MPTKYLILYKDNITDRKYKVFDIYIFGGGKHETYYRYLYSCGKHPGLCEADNKRWIKEYVET